MGRISPNTSISAAIARSSSSRGVPRGTMLPPGPRLAARLLLDPSGGFVRLHRKYGPIFTVRYPGFPPEVYVTTAELAEQVFRTDQGGGWPAPHAATSW